MRWPALPVDNPDVIDQRGAPPLAALEGQVFPSDQVQQMLDDQRNRMGQNFVVGLGVMGLIGLFMGYQLGREQPARSPLVRRTVIGRRSGRGRVRRMR